MFRTVLLTSAILLLGTFAPSVVVEAAEAPANPVSFDLWTFIFQAANVLIIMFLLYKMLFKPLGGLMQQREEFVENSLSQARATKEEAHKLLAEYKEQRARAESDAQKIVEKATKDAEEYGRRIRLQADEDAEKALEKAKVDIARARDRALAEIRDEVATLAILAAGKVIGRAINEDDHRSLVREFVDKAGELQ